MHLERLRLLVPLERCALQGIPVPPHILALFTRDFLNDMAGNSFCAPVINQMIIALLAVHAKKWCIAHPPVSAATMQPDMSFDSLMSEGLAGLDDTLMLCEEAISGIDLAAELGLECGQ